MKQKSTNRKTKFLLNRALKIQRTRKKRRNIKYSSPSIADFRASKRKNKKPKIKPLRITLPELFSVENNINGVLKFFKPFLKYKHQGIRHIKFDMTEIKDIDLPAIVIFLTKITQLNNENISFSGNLPVDPHCKDIFLDSGFLSHMRTIGGKTFEQRSESNLIVKIGRHQTESELTAETIKKAVKELTGLEKYYTPVQSIVQEMIGNAVEYAYVDNKYWLFCVNIDNESITFILSDGGKGILKTLNRKHKKYFDSLQFKTNIDILLGAFKKKYESNTGDPNRNKGLPMIKKRCDNKEILELKVLTNDVYLNLSDQSKSLSVNENYFGTLYTWKVTKAILENENR